jgi:preprotein translocase subunit YajC
MVPWWGWLIIAIAVGCFLYFVVVAIVSFLIWRRASKQMDKIHDSWNNRF